MNAPEYITSSCDKCGGRIEFPAEGMGMTVDCPHCGWKTQLSAPEPAKAEEPAPKRRIAVGWKVALLVVLCMALAIGLFQWQKGKVRIPSPASATPTSQTNHSVSIKSPGVPEQLTRSTNHLSIGAITLEKTKSSSVVYAVGTVKNELDRQRFALRVELDLFDADGAKVGTASDYLSILEPKKDWRFKAMVLEKKAVSAKLAAIKEEQ